MISFLLHSLDIMSLRHYILDFTTLQITVTHYFSTQKAKRLLDYKPEMKLSDWKEIIDELEIKSSEANVKKFLPCIKLLVILISGMIAITCHVFV